MKARIPNSRVIAQVTGQASPRHVCRSCQRSSVRQYASAAAVAESSTNTQPDHFQPSTETPSLSPRPVYRVNAGIVLSRPPIITRDLHPFESAFYFYQRRLNDRLALPFSRYFYFKRGTPADLEWKRKQKERLTPSRDIGIYNAYGKEGWNDELLTGAPESRPDHQVEALLNDAESAATSGEPEAFKEIGVEQAAATTVEFERPMPRTTDADRNNDQQSLNRKLQRALYLLVRNKDGQWTFPSALVEGRESLRAAASRTLTMGAGPNMNTWIVGNAPIGHCALDYEAPQASTDKEHFVLGEKTFFLKGRIMTGQADLKDNAFGFQDFKWLAKEEIMALVTPKYWSMTENMLTER